jgi:peptidoglycan/LPS O-acetylase OafA/YrhL
MTSIFCFSAVETEYMTRGLSLYLDLLRLIAALEVFAFHIAGFSFLGIPRSGWNAYGHEAVTVFFVLSGFVIRHAAGQNDDTIEKFATSRLTRVYSVALPCLALTFLFDTIGHAFAIEYYSGLITDSSAWLRLAVGATMLNEVWVSVQMLSNTPYWSISYEFWYYIIFAALFYVSGRRKWLLAVAFGIVAGPKIMLLFPIWVMGWFAYVERLSLRLPTWVRIGLFIQPAFVLILYDHFHLVRAGGAFLQAHMGYELWRNGLSWSRFVLSDTLLGASVALHLIGAKGLGDELWTLLHRLEIPIRFAAARSFTLYLLHQPTILVSAACLAAWPLGVWRGLIVASVSLCVILLVALITEGQRHRFKPIVVAALRGIGSLYKIWLGERYNAGVKR